MNLRLHFLALFVFSVASYVQADSINYGNFDGNTLTYIDVTETSMEPLPLYGQPEIFGDNLSMPGTGFISQSENGEINFLDGRLSFMIEADPGTTINSVTIREFGAFFTFGEDSIASISGIAFVETLEGGLFSGTFDFINFGIDGLPQSGDWIRELTITFPETTKITVNLDNQLFTFADTPGLAFIDKKGVDIFPGGVVIPEPTSAAILALGLMGLAIRSRRR